jgi:hypothetical protein
MAVSSFGALLSLRDANTCCALCDLNLGRLSHFFNGKGGEGETICTKDEACFSSFRGPSQSLTVEGLGELEYNLSEPGLALIETAEVKNGPRSTPPEPPIHPSGRRFSCLELDSRKVQDFYSFPMDRSQEILVPERPSISIDSNALRKKDIRQHLCLHGPADSPPPSIFWH